MGTEQRPKGVELAQLLQQQGTQRHQKEQQYDQEGQCQVGTEATLSTGQVKQ